MVVDYTSSDEISYGIIEAYQWLLRDDKSNLGWRILVEIFFDEANKSAWWNLLKKMSES